MSKDDKPLVPGNHLGSSPDVTEGGKAPSPGEGAGHPKGAASKAEAEGRGTDDTSTATQGKAEKDHAARMGAQKPQARH
jgi:hypothetical protein